MSREPWFASPEALARRFHELYEALAPNFGYETRRESAVPWEEVPEQNKDLMIAVCDVILNPPHANSHSLYEPTLTERDHADRLWRAIDIQAVVDEANREGAA